MSVADTSSWYGKPITQEELMAAFKKVLKEHLKYTYAFCIGFIDTSPYKEDGDSHIWIADDDAPKQNGKRVVLMKAGNPFHKYLLKIEEEEDIHFERLTDETMREIVKGGLMLFTNEEGTLHNPFPIEPIWGKPLDPEIAKITDEHFFEML